jgi:metal-responsive CopG/Arc/MetJ family transcriptional regulator
MRTIVELPDEQVAALKRLSEDMHLSRAELMRRAVREYLARHRPEPPEQAFGLWKARPMDALGIQKRLRSEWDR